MTVRRVFENKKIMGRRRFLPPYLFFWLAPFPLNFAHSLSINCTGFPFTPQQSVCCEKEECYTHSICKRTQIEFSYAKYNCTEDCTVTMVTNKQDGVPVLLFVFTSVYSVPCIGIKNTSLKETPLRHVFCNYTSRLWWNTASLCCTP